jgi:hypothetical protein
MNQDDKTNQEIGDTDSENTGESTLSSDIKEDDLDHQLEVFNLCQWRRDKSLHTTRVPLPKKWSRADPVIACPPLPNSRNLPAAMAPPLPKRQKSSLLNKLSESDRTPSAWALVLPNNWSADQNSPQPKARSNQNVPQHQKRTFEIAKMIMEGFVFTKTPWAILSDDK